MNAVMAVSQEANPPFWNEIQRFRTQDKREAPPKKALLLIGSSSFTMWTDVKEYFPGYRIINRGFGGSSLTDLIRYQDEIILPYEPAQILIYCGENDIASSDTVTGMMVFDRFRTLFTGIRKHYPKVPVIFVSLKPSPSRWKMKDRMIEANRLIRSYLKKEKKAKFVDIWNDMLGADGQPRDELFLADRLHMNAKGYSIWQRRLSHHLDKKARIAKR